MSNSRKRPSGQSRSRRNTPREDNAPEDTSGQDTPGGDAAAGRGDDASARRREDSAAKRREDTATRRRGRPAPPPPANPVDRYFRITERGSTLGAEIRGGLVTFFTMAYIIVLNPLIIGTQQDADGRFLGGGTSPDLPLVAAATALVAGVMTILM